ncbi:MAG: hypothetical protein KJ674_03910 [Nanoarchaeota archaeon]|nr:hypothetical protein [Nanoarchaeota archaeon]
MQIERQTAYKLWISSIHNSQYTKTTEEFSPNYITFDNKNISRINIIASIINKYETPNYISLLVDDSSSQISVKVWNENIPLLKDVDKGDIILIIGKIKQSSLNNSIYIAPDFVKKTTLNFELLRKLELLKEYGKPSKIEKKEEIKENIEEIKISNNLRQQVLNALENIDTEEGVEIQKIVTNLNQSEVIINEVLEELIKGGEIFQIKNKFKLMK